MSSHPAPSSAALDAGADGFVPAGYQQLVELHTACPAEVERLLESWRQEASEQTQARISIGRDWQDEGHFVLFVEFNNPDAATPSPCALGGQRYADAVVRLLDGPPRFLDLDCQVAATS